MSEERIRRVTPPRGIDAAELQDSAKAGRDHLPTPNAAIVPGIAAPVAVAADNARRAVPEIDPGKLPPVNLLPFIYAEYKSMHEGDKSAERAIVEDMERAKSLLAVLASNVTLLKRIQKKFGEGIQPPTQTRIGTFLNSLPQDAVTSLVKYTEQVYDDLTAIMHHFCQTNALDSFIETTDEKMQITEATLQKFEWTLQTLARAYPDIAGEMATEGRFRELVVKRNQHTPGDTGGAVDDAEQMFLAGHVVNATLFKGLMKNIIGYQSQKESLNPKQQEHFLANVETLLHNMSTNIALPHLDALPHANNVLPVQVSYVLRLGVIFSELLTLITILRQQLRCHPKLQAVQKKK